MKQGTSRGLLRAHEDLLTAFRRVADCALIGFGHTLSCLFFQDTWRAQMTTATVIAIVVFNLAAEWRGLYRPWRSEPLFAEIGEAVVAWIVVLLVLCILGFVTKTSATFSRTVTFGWLAVTLVLLALWRIAGRLVVRQLRANGRNSRTVAVLGATATCEGLCRQITERPWLGMSIRGIYDDRRHERRHRFADLFAPYSGGMSELLRDAREGKIDIVYIALPLRAETRIAECLEALGDTTATVCIAADFLPYELLNAHWHQIGDVPVVSVCDSPFQGGAAVLKRLEDIVLGLMILPIIALPMLAIAIAVKLTSKGPAIFRQRRFGLNGRSIQVLKFRTMTVCEDGDDVKQATRDDLRVTKLGAFLRRTSLDELPQFLQVIGGSMSIVGPRPHAVAHNETYRRLIRRYMLRHKVKPGITGWAQVNGLRGETDTVEKMQQRVLLDLEYIGGWNLGFDLRIIWLTIFAVVAVARNRSAY